MNPFLYRKHRIKSLRSYVICMITGIIAFAMLLSGIFFYLQTSHTLKQAYQEQMLQQLDNTMLQLNEQISLIDSLYPLFMSNNLIYSSLERDSSGTAGLAMSVEKQMAYLLITNYVWKEQFIDSVSIYANNGNTYRVSTADSEAAKLGCLEIYEKADKKYPSLQLFTSDKDQNTLYFMRNIFSSNTGEAIASMMIAVNGSAWIDYIGSSLNSGWFIYLCHDNVELSSLAGRDMPVDAENYLTVSENLHNLSLSAAVVAPKEELLDKLHASLSVYLTVMLTIIFSVLLISYVLSRTIVRPVTRMIASVDYIAEGRYEETIPTAGLYEEFHSLADAFNHMLSELNAYHADNLEKQLLLKNAEIQALQSQINPHFLFNTLNTLAWKAQMSDNPELYQMIISLGELLKMNVLSRASSCIPLKDELKYVKLYIYLQKMRFEDKVSVSFDIEPGLDEFPVPCFCIQPLVENAFLHGLETKKGNGTLRISIRKEDASLCVLVQDNGTGFHEIPSLQEESIPPDAPHTHIGLYNLNRRLLLLYGADACLHISSVPNTATTVTFRIPIKEAVHDFPSADC